MLLRNLKRCTTAACHSKVMMSIFYKLNNSFFCFDSGTHMQHGEGDDGGLWPENGYCWDRKCCGKHLLDGRWRTTSSNYDNGGWGTTRFYATMEAWGVLRGGNRHCDGLLYHLGVGCHVGVFQGIDGAHYTVLTVVGRRLGRERRHSKWTHTLHTRTHTHRCIRIIRL